MKRVITPIFLCLLLCTGAFLKGIAQCTPSAPQTFTNNTSSPIPDVNTLTSTITVTGAPTFLYDVNLFTTISHTFSADLDITLKSPSGTTIVITTDNGGSNDDVFKGTLWDDKAGATNPTGVVTDYTYANGVVATPLSPEQSLGAFVGENPNGVWTLTVTDDLSGDVGTLSNWSLTITGFNAAPTVATATYNNTTSAAIPDVNTLTSTITVSGAGTQIIDVNLLTSITHTFSADLDITLTSPAGTVVTITTDNGGSNDNVFNGTLWDDKTGATNASVTDYVYSNGVTATPLVPEEGLSAFIGENPNGVWTLSVTDDLSGDVGTLQNWSLVIGTSTCSGGGGSGPCTPAGAQTFSNTTSAAIPDVNTLTSTITVSGAPAYLYDVNLFTTIAHTFSADLDVTLTSPSGTVVTITTDNGGSNDNVFNGTLWDDQAGATNPTGVVTDYVYANNVVATPLSPEEPLGAFIGENPNGVWTLSVTDDLAGDVGTLSNWSLSISGLPTPPSTSAATFSNTTATAIPDVNTLNSTITVSGAGTQILDVNLLTAITHTFSADLDVTLKSPAGTVVTITTDNGGSNDNVFNGTLWDDKAGATNPTGVVTDYVYTNNVVATPLSPEEPLSAFIGENPNGVWTLSVTDDLSGDVGTLNSWSLAITTSQCSVAPCVLTCPANISVGSTPGQCGAVVNYPAPTISGPCGTVTATPASGSLFPIGTTMVNVSVSGGGPTCSFTVTVTDSQLPVITAQPVGNAICEGENATFSVTASNAVSYQWQVSNGGGFSNINGATNSSYTVSNAAAAANGSQYRVVVTGSCNSVTSSAATLTVNPLPGVGPITATPYGAIHPGQTTSLTTGFTGMPTGFEWSIDGTVVQTGVSPTIHGLDIDNLGIVQVTMTDVNNCKNSAQYTLKASPDFQFYVYPVPNNGQFQVRFYSHTLGVKRTLRVYDSKGGEVFRKEFTMNGPYERMDVDISRNTPGTYHVELRDAQGVQIGSASVVVFK